MLECALYNKRLVRAERTLAMSWDSAREPSLWQMNGILRHLDNFD